MTFSLNPSVTYVQIDEPILHELYQSKTPIVPDDPSFHGRPCEAYICTSKDGKHLKIYVSFLDTLTKQIYVYTPDADPVGASGYANLLEQAKEFVAAKGFGVDKVNIDFSPAIRQVIIRSLRVMRPPIASAAKKVIHLVPQAEKAPTQTGCRDAGVDHKAPVASANVPASPSPAGEPMLAEKEAELKQLRTDLAAARQGRETAEKALADEAQRLLAEKAELQLGLEQAETARRSAEELLTKAADRQTHLEREGAAREDSGLALAEEAAALRRELAEAAVSQEAMTEAFNKELSATRESLSSAMAEMERLEQELAAEKAAGGAALERLQAEIAALQDGFEREKAADAFLIETLRAELAKAADAANSERAGLRDELATARESLVHLEQAQGELREARLELAQLSKDNSLILVELEQLAEERRAESAAHAEEVALLRAEADRLTKALHVQEQAANMEQTALRSELRKLVAELAGSALPRELAALPAEAATPAVSIPEPSVQRGPVPSSCQAAAGGQPVPVPVASEEPEEEDVPSSGAEEALAILGTEFGGGSFMSPGGEGTTEFRRQADLDAIPYRSSADLLAVYHSINSIQAVPVGSEVQKCNGFVCVVAEQGVPHIFVAWHMPECGRVVVLVPDQQPHDKETCSRVLGDAIQYFEIMGFMMERHDLGATSQKRRGVAKKVPVLRRVEKKEVHHEPAEALKRSA